MVQKETTMDDEAGEPRKEHDGKTTQRHIAQQQQKSLHA